MEALTTLFDSKTMSSFTALIHTAWSTVPFTSEADPGREEREDFPLVKKILETLHQIEQEASVPRLIFISSASVYGNQKGEPATELALCKPLSNYARAKLVVERLMLQAAVDDPRLKVVILRASNLIGIPFNSAVPQGILPKMMEAAKTNQELELWGNGKCSKDYLWIDDFLEALKKAIQSSIQGVFNVGSGENFSLLDLIQLVEKITQETILIKYRPAYFWDVTCSLISSEAFSKATGWKAQADIIEEIKKSIAT